MSEKPARGYIGASLPRPNARRHLAGRGQYVDDLKMARMAHAAFVRSPHAHARIVRIDSAAAARAAGVVLVLTGADVAKLCTPYVGVLNHYKGMRSPPQYPLAIERACWQGEPVVAVIAESRAEAEDAAQLVEVEWEPLPVVADAETALDAATPVLHPEFDSNLCVTKEIDTGGVDEAFAGAHAVVEETFTVGRLTAVSLEPRSTIADFNPTENQLTVWQSTQAPFMMQWIFARHFGIPETSVRVIAPDIGGGFGLKIHVYGDDMTTVAASMLLGRPVKFVADRLESFVSDFHSRGHRIKARMAVSKSGDILAIEIDDLYGIGAYSGYPRGSANEGMQIVNLTGAPYRQRIYRARTRAVFQNKQQCGPYRAVGHPIVCTVTEGLVDLAANAVNMDPAEFRRRNYVSAKDYPYKLVTGLTLEILSQHEALDKLLELMDYKALRREQAALRKQGVYRGIGLASFVETTNGSAASYGAGGASIAAQDSCTMRLTATGHVTVASCAIEMGQGAAAAVGQIAATAMGLPIERVKIIIGDTEMTPYGGGNSGSRGTGIGGEAVFQAGRALKSNILSFVARLDETEASLFDIRDGNVVDAASGALRMTLEEVARTAYFRTDRVPLDYQPELTVTRSYAQKTYPGIVTNGIQASWLEVDTETGFVKLLKHWVVDDCGTLINPMLVDEQLRGGVVLGLGAALFEQVLHSAEGQFVNGSLIDYLVPMAGEMPDIAVGHTCTPTATSALGAKGAGEAGTAGSAAAGMNAINDALRPFKARVAQMPFTPERILRALGKIA